VNGEKQKGRKNFEARQKKKSNLTSSLTLPEDHSPSTMSITVTDEDLQCGPNSEHIPIIS
jgi:hypothetical protein